MSDKKTILNIGNLNKDFLETGIAELKIDNNKSITEPIERKIGFKQKIHNELNLTWRNKFVTQFVQGKQMTINFPSKTIKVLLTNINNFQNEIQIVGIDLILIKEFRFQKI